MGKILVSNMFGTAYQNNLALFLNQIEKFEFYYFECYATLCNITCCYYYLWCNITKQWCVDIKNKFTRLKSLERHSSK